MKAATLQSHRARIRRVVEWIRAAPETRFTLDQLAARCNMAPTYFSAVFRETTSVAPFQFIAAIRIEYAKRLLAETKWSVGRIAMESGYLSIGTFTRLFTQSVGLSPRAFRFMCKVRREQAVESVLVGAMGIEVEDDADEEILGTVLAPEHFSGPVLIGLFPSRIPSGQPRAATVLLEPGRFRLRVRSWDIGKNSVLLAGAVPQLSQMRAILTPQAILVGHAEISTKGCGLIEIQLRDRCCFDPPLLTVPRAAIERSDS